MKKISIIILVLSLYISNAYCEVPVMTITTSYSIGTAISFSLRTNTDNKIVQVDFGNGVLIDKTIGTTNTFVNGILVGSQTVKIYGDGITHFICFGNQLTALDVSKNTTLTTLWCYNNQLKTIDVSKNSSLDVFFCYNNLLDSIDITHNLALTMLDCCDNNLTTLDVSKNTSLISLNCFNNFLTYNTLSLTQVAWQTYLYAPQKPILITDNLGIGAELDLSSQLKVNNTTTVYTWKTKSGNALLPGTDYIVTNGKTVFLKEQTDSVYCEMENAAFPLFTGLDKLKTTCTKLYIPFISMTTTKSIGSTFTLILVAKVANTPINVDFGNGILINASIGTSVTTVSGIIDGSQTVKVYGPGINNIQCSSNQISSLDASKYTALKSLFCDKNMLTSLDFNKNTSLETLICNDNQITSLNISRNSLLSYLNCSNNQLSTLDLTKTSALVSFWCDNNLFKSLDISKNSALDMITCSGNQLTYLDVSMNSVLTGLYCSSNQITSLDVSKNKVLKSLTCDYNQLSTLDITKNTSLTFLSCNNNNINTLSVANAPLKTLFCSYNLLTVLDVSNNTTLTKLRCFNNQLDTLGVSNNTALTELNCTNNKLSTLKISNGGVLQTLYCQNNQLISIDVTQNPALNWLYCYNNQLSVLDVSNNTSLTYLFCSKNRLNSLDVTKNTSLQSLGCEYNYLTSLDVSKNISLTSLSCNDNYLTLSSLPIKLASWTSYSYAPQKPFSISKNINVGVELDLSSQLLINGNITDYSWKTLIGAKLLIEGTDYSINNGKTIFLKATNDSVYCQMSNLTFPGFTGTVAYKTSNIKVMSSTVSEEIKSIKPIIYTQSKTLFMDLPYKAQLSIYNIQGELVLSKYINIGTQNLYVPKTGVYLIKLYGNGSLFIQKIIID